MKDKDDETFVSVITVVYNAGNALEETIQSVIAQRGVKKEFIIIDGGSTDGTLDILRKYEKHIDRWISERDRGIYDAMNKGVDLATGRWLNFMNAGDRFASDQVLSSFMSMVRSEDEFVYGEALVEYPSFSTKFETVGLSQMWKRMPFCHQASFVKTALARQLKFDVSYKLSADYDFIYRAYTSGTQFRHIDLIVCLFDFKHSASKENRYLSLRERMNIVRKNDNGFVKHVYYVMQLQYVALAEKMKHILGDKATQKITKLLRQKGAK